MLAGAQKKPEEALFLLLEPIPLQGLYRHQPGLENTLNQSKPSLLETRHQDLVGISKKQHPCLLFPYQISLYLREIEGERYEPHILGDLRLNIIYIDSEPIPL